jgi:hypothetical protein
MEEKRPSQTTIRDLVQDLDLTIPLHELVGDPALLDHPIEIDPQELKYLEALAREYLQELSEQGLIPDLPPMDIDPKLLEPVRRIDQDFDFGR